MPSLTDPGPPVDETTIRLARKRFARRQWARRWLAWRRLVVGVLLLGAAAGLVWLVFFSSVLSVRGVTVVGTEVLDDRRVQRAASVPTGSPLATVDLAAVAERVEGLAPVLTVDVSRSWPDRVRVAVTERVPVAVVERGGVVRGLDAHGVLFRRYPARPPGLPLVRMAAGTRAEALAEAARVIEVLPTPLSGRVEYLAVDTVDAISLRLQDGRLVRWGSAADSDHKARVLAVLLEQDARLYDVSVPGQPVIRR